MNIKSIETFACKEKTISPSEFLKLTDDDRSNIKSIQIVPPHLGAKDFGKLRLILKNPIYMPYTK